MESLAGEGVIFFSPLNSPLSLYSPILTEKEVDRCAPKDSLLHLWRTGEVIIAGNMGIIRVTIATPNPFLYIYIHIVVRSFNFVPFPSSNAVRLEVCAWQPASQIQFMEVGGRWILMMHLSKQTHIQVRGPPRVPKMG